MHRPTIERDHFIDFVRVVAIAVVVTGHWATTTIVWTPERVSSVNALSVIPAVRIVTWVVQVMPLVFFAGGFANAVSLQRAGDTLTYLRTRMLRLLTPTAVFLGIWLVIGLAIELIDPQGPGKVRAAEAAALPLWFLGIYIVAVAAAPAMIRLHRRFRWWIPGLLAGGVAMVDSAAIGLDVSDLGGLNYALVWLLAHQVGFFYADGSLQRLGARWAAGIALSGLGMLVVLVSVAGYPVSLVGVPGARSNAEPPTLAMVAATVWLVGAVLALRPALGRRLCSGAPAVRRLHDRLLSIYLWHITALMISAGAWRAFGLPEPDIGSGGWWALRIPWVMAAAGPLALLLAFVGRFEIHPAPSRSVGERSALMPVAVGLGAVSLAVGVLGFGETGFLPLAPIDGEAILSFDFTPVQNVVHLLIGAGLVAAAGSKRWGAAATLCGALAFVALGAAHWAGLVDRLGMNDAGAVAHVAVGGAALAGAAVAPISRRRARGPGA